MILTNPFHVAEIIKKIEKKEFQYALLRDAQCAKQIIWNLVINDIPFSIINYGSGVKRIIHQGVVCEHCFGKGFVREIKDDD